MEDYHILTLNTSRLGEGLANSSLTQSGPIGDLFNLIPDDLQDDVSAVAGAITEELGIEDFYSAHMLDYCFGQYIPAEAPNATVSSKDIHKNLTGCSNQTAMFWFNPNDILEKALNKSGLGITLDDLEWPEDIQRGLDALRLVSITSFVLYCIAIALIFLSLVAAVPALFASGRLAACLNLIVVILAFLAIGLASALVTAVIVKGGDLINEHGKDIGVGAKKGSKFMGLTWAATVLMFFTMIMWSIELCFGHRRRNTYAPAKHG